MLPATWDFEIRIQKVICYAFLSCPVSAFLMIGVLPASTQLPAFSLKANTKERPRVMVRRRVTGRKVTERNPSQFDTSLLQPEMCFLAELSFL